MICRQVKLKSGGSSWICRADGPTKPNGSRNQVERRGKTQREAKKKVEDEIARQENTGINQKLAKTITFDKVALEWMRIYIASGAKAGSIRIRNSEVKLLNKYLENVPIVNVTFNFYQNILISMSSDGNNGKPYSLNTLLGVNVCAGMIIKYAIRNKLTNEDPRIGAVIPRKQFTVEELENETTEETYFESDELSSFLSVVINKGLKLDLERFYTLAFSGMRPGELCALKKSDLNFDNNTIRISKTLTNNNNNMRKYLLDTTKTNKVRVIDMDVKVMSMLKRLVVKNDKHRMKYRTLLEGFHDEEFVFCRPNGYPYSPGDLRKRMTRLMSGVKTDKELTPHDFRHTHISMMTESGVKLPTIMDRVGHSDPKTTLKVYTHVTNKMKEESVTKVTSLHKDIIDKLPIQN